MVPSAVKVMPSRDRVLLIVPLVGVTCSKQGQRNGRPGAFNASTRNADFVLRRRLGILMGNALSLVVLGRLKDHF